MNEQRNNMTHRLENFTKDLTFNEINIVKLPT